jgi:hypothetical protein
LIRFNSPTVKVRGQKIKAMSYMIEQAGAMEKAAEGEDVPESILALVQRSSGNSGPDEAGSYQSYRRCRRQKCANRKLQQYVVINS